MTRVKVARFGDAMYGRSGIVLMQSNQGPRLQKEPWALIQWDDMGKVEWMRCADLKAI